jgi:anti-sigma regulatory factor (Ser/Thr protein kinase)
MGAAPGGATTFSVPVGADAPARARRAAADRLAPLGTDATERGLLALSELVTNVVRHARVADDEPIDIVIATVDDRRIRVEVQQPTRLAERSVRQVPLREDGGMGLMIVERVSERWGMDPGPPGRVWFEIC